MMQSLGLPGLGFPGLPGLGFPGLPGMGFPGLPGMPGVMIMSVQMEPHPIDNLMSSVINNLFNPNIPQMSKINMPQISSSKNFLYIDYE